MAHRVIGSIGQQNDPNPALPAKGDFRAVTIHVAAVLDHFHPFSRFQYPPAHPVVGGLQAVPVAQHPVIAGNLHKGAKYLVEK